MEIFKLFGSIFIDSKDAQNSIHKTSNEAEGFGKKLSKGIKTVGKWAAAAGAAAAAVGGAMFKAAQKIAGTTDEIDKASRRAGTSAENYQKLNYAMGQSGISSEKFEKTMIRQQKALVEAAEGTEAYAEAYDRLGVSIYDANGNLRDADVVYEETLLKLADMEDMNARNAIANQIFGKSYADLAPILDAGSKGISELTTRASELGLVLSQETIDAGVKFGDTLDDVKQMGGAVFNVIAAELLPILQSFLDWIVSHAPEIQEISKNTAAVVRGVAERFAEFWDKHGKLITRIAKGAWKLISEAAKVAMEVISSVVDAVCALIEGDWKGFWDSVVNIVTNVGSRLYDAAKSAMEWMWNGLKSVWTSISNWVSEKVSWLADKLAFWRSAKKEMEDEDEPKPKPKHAAGLPYVPYDGYVAELHKGETILTANSSKNMVSDIVNGLAAVVGSGASGNITVNLVVDKKILAQTIFDPLKEVGKQRGVALV